MIRVIQKGDFSHLEKFLTKAKHMSFNEKLRAYGELGVAALAAYTPVDSGKPASSWGYEIHNSSGHANIYWTNSNVNEGVNIAILIQYGHGTGTGGYVLGRDYINPAMRPVFDAMADDIWKEVSG